MSMCHTVHSHKDYILCLLCASLWLRLGKCVKNDWKAPIYTFFKLLPMIGYVDGRHVHMVECMAKPAKEGVGIPD